MMKHLVLWFVKLTGVLPFLLLYRPRKYYEGDKRSLRTASGEILIANHTTLMDFAMMLFVYPFRTIRVLMAEVLYRRPFSAWFMKQLHGIRVNRDVPENTDRLSEAMTTLTDGGTVGVFPEGKLNQEGQNFGPLLPFHSGAAYMAIKTGALIRPLYFHAHIGLHTSGIMIGEPIDLRAMFGCSTETENLVKATKYLKNKMERLREELQFQSGYQKHSLLSRFTRWSAYWGMKIAFRYRLHFPQNHSDGVNISKACIIACNHTSIFDPPLLCTIFRNTELHILACESLYEYPMLSILLKRLGCIKIDRNILDMESFHIMQSVLQKNECVGIFPEGMLSTTGELAPFHPGAVLAAIASDVDIIPVYISGEGKAFSKHGRNVWIGDAIHYSGDITPDNIQRGTESLFDAVRQLEKRSKENGENE